MKGSILHLQLLIAAILVTLIARNESDGYRLKRSVLPSFYNLTINIQASRNGGLGYSFIGEVAITLQTNQSDIYEITLHKDSLDISSCLVYNKDGILCQNVTITSLKYDQETHLLTVPLLEALTANENYTLYFKYTGYVKSRGQGVISEFYKTGKYSYHSVYITQLEPVYARIVFPCFDEPTFKAKFQLNLGRPSEYNAVSNTRLIRTTKEGNNSYVDHFDVTPIMPTYQLAFVISEYQARGNHSEFAVLSAPENYNYTEFSFNVAERVTDAYNKVFDMPYKNLGNEVLLFATSGWFDDNAMDNWGLIILSEKILVQKPGYTDGHANTEFTCLNIAHEIAHMWFGNSVTLSWWSHYWLNEGFARFYEFFLTHQLYRNYHLDQQFVVDNLQRILEKDAVAGSLPLTSPEMSVQSPAEINNQSNAFTQDKGASIIRMWRNLMGGENFRESIRSYLKQYHLQNTSPTDLFAHLKQNWPAQPEVDLDTFFSDFTEQVGYPMVIVNITQDNQKIILHQKRFLYDYEDGSDATLRYTIPITFATNLDRTYNNLTPYTYFDRNKTSIEISFEEPIDWIILNQKQSNYYRIFYDKPILTKIKQLFSTIKGHRIPVENKAQIIDDLFHFAKAGMIDYAEVFEFMEYLSTEIEHIPWRTAYVGMEQVVRRLTPQQLPHFEKYLKNISYVAFNEVTAKSSSTDSVFDVYNRNLFVSWLCKYQNVNCINQVNVLFEGSLEKPSPDYREIFYCAVSRTTAHAHLWNLYHIETNSDEKDLLSRAISCSRDYTTYLNVEVFLFENNDQQAIGVIQMYQQNPDLITPIFLMIRENIWKMIDRIGTLPMVIVLKDMVEYFTTREQEELFSDFVENKSHLFDNKSAETLKSALPTIRKNIEWAEQRLGKLDKYLAKWNEAQ